MAEEPVEVDMVGGTKSWNSLVAKQRFSEPMYKLYVVL